MQTYTLRGIQSMLGLSRSVLAGLVAAGFVTPARGPRREYRFSFQDVVLLRTAVALQAQRIPPRRIVQALRRLRATLPAELPLSGLRISAEGSEIVVHEGGARWGVDSGQRLIDFEVRPAAEGEVCVLGHDAAALQAPAGDGDEPAAHQRAAEAATWFERAVEIEAHDPPSAEAAYRRAIAADPDNVDPVLNLGVMLCEAGRCADAVDIYRQALPHHEGAALLHFNLAIAHEDLGHASDALAAYERSLRLDPGFADAHFNVARLHEQLGHAAQAIRHYSAYRRLQRTGGDAGV